MFLPCWSLEQPCLETVLKLSCQLPYEPHGVGRDVGAEVRSGSMTSATKLLSFPAVQAQCRAT